MNFPESSLANLGSLGYTEDGARFLYLVATHSGYFSMRQFLQFTGTKSGDKSMTFSQKLLGKGHATARSFLRNGLVYHLFSRIVYRAIDRENLRNRRAHSLEHIRTRLVVLDFVLAHLQYEYLETEDDKLNYFCQQLDIPKELLPRKRYSGAVHNRTTERYFVDKFPMFLSSGALSSPVVTFTFVDPGLGIVDSFKTHLLAYGSLFEALSEVRIVYISPDALQRKIRAKKSSAISGSRSCGMSGNTGSSQPTTWSSSISRTSATPVIGARDSIQVGETASYRTTTSALRFKIWHHHAVDGKDSVAQALAIRHTRTDATGDSLHSTVAAQRRHDRRQRS
jgi:hypothetical protein